MTAHAYLPPHGADKWRYCAVWPLMNAQYPELVPSPASAEGTAAHWAAGELWHRRPVDVGHAAPNGVRVDDEMLDAAELYCRTVHGAEPSDVSDTRWETQIHGNRVHPTHNWGTPDAWRYNYVLRVWDFKYGHRYVPAFENWQLVNYAALLLDFLSIDGIRDQTLDVELTIVQPRNHHRDGPVRTWKLRAAELRPYVNELRNAADRALQTERTATPGNHCDECPGRHVCPALANAGGWAIDHAVAAAVPLELPPQAVGRELTALRRAHRLLEARMTGLEEHALALLRQGKRLPGWMVEHGAGRERWNRPIGEIVMLGELTGVSLSKPGVMTPNQARTAGVPESVVKAYSERPAGAAKLVPEDASALRQAFGAT